MRLSAIQAKYSTLQPDKGEFSRQSLDCALFILLWILTDPL